MTKVAHVMAINQHILKKGGEFVQAATKGVEALPVLAMTGKVSFLEIATSIFFARFKRFKR